MSDDRPRRRSPSRRSPAPPAADRQPAPLTNGYLIRGDDGWTLVDCGWDIPDVLEALRSQITDVGARLEDIRTLVITHYHTDHYGMAGTLVGLTQADC